MTENSNPATPVGLIGVGLLGAALAERLLRHGYSVNGFDIDSPRCQWLAAAGGAACDDAKEVLRRCQCVLISLPTSDTVGEMLAAAGSAVGEGHVLIDTTTGNPQQMIETQSVLRRRGAAYVEATVAGSSQQVRQGEAALFLGGEPAVIDQVDSLLEALSNKRFILGPVGAASRFKLVHNLILGLHRLVLAEGLTFAESLGIDPTQALEILQQTPAASQVMETKGAKMVRGDRAAQARLSQHLKDVRLILSAAQQAGASVPLSELHRQLLEQAVQLGWGDADNSAVIEVYRRAPDNRQ